MKCPYGEPGDRLWVRETFCDISTDHRPVWFYRADGDEKPDWVKHWKPSIFMPREASRITLEIVSVRVESLQAISGRDAIAEGIDSVQMPTGAVMYDDYMERGAMVARPVSSYATLWDLINGPGSWATNPFVWVIEFKTL
jgi:hypothetical protein